MEGLKYSEILKSNAALAKVVGGCPEYKISILSNITCHQLKDILSFNLRTHGLNPEITIGNYDNIIQDSYRCSEAQMVIIHYDLVAILDKYADFAEDFSENQLVSLLQTLESEIDLILDNLNMVPAVVFNAFLAEGIYSDTFLSTKAKRIAGKLNARLSSRERPNLHIVDIHKTLMRVGCCEAFDWRMYYLSSTLYHVTFWKEYVYEISSLVYKYTGKLKKAIIFDCDNTLWKGILGEDGESGIDMSGQSKIGRIYFRIQQIAVWLSGQGILIGLCSKNNASDIDKVLVGHPDMKLRKEHLVACRINWADKASNLREIAEELNIGLDSVIFVDDSPFEINLVREQLPDVLTFQVPAALHLYPTELLKIVERYLYLSGNKADVIKTQQYKTQQLRVAAKNKYSSLEEYLGSLEIEIKIKKDDITQVERIAQLTQKTNQFNLTTKRYTEAQIKLLIESRDWEVYSVSVSDKFGDNGLTGVCIIEKQDNRLMIDSFLMSCRIMGRNIERAIMDHLVSINKKRGISIMRATYIATLKNKPVTDFYETVGFRVMDCGDGRKNYELILSDYKPSCTEYIKIKD